MTRGHFIALEGGEGAGKSSALAALGEALRARGLDPVLTREPGGTAEGTALRQLLLSPGQDWTAEAELLLMNAARAQHVARVIGPALAAGRVVLCDRYVGSTLAYQGGGRGLPEATIRSVHAIATGDLWPDLTLFFDIAPEPGLLRSRRRLAAAGSAETRFEALDQEFHAAVRASFLAQATAPGWVTLDAAQPIEAVQTQALNALLMALGDL